MSKVAGSIYTEPESRRLEKSVRVHRVDRQYLATRHTSPDRPKFVVQSSLISRMTMIENRGIAGQAVAVLGRRWIVYVFKSGLLAFRGSTLLGALVVSQMAIPSCCTRKFRATSGTVGLGRRSRFLALVSEQVTERGELPTITAMFKALRFRFLVRRSRSAAADAGRAH